MINIPRTITLNRQKLNRIERDLQKVLIESPEKAAYQLDMKYVMHHIGYAISILRDIEKYIDNINSGGI